MQKLSGYINRFIFGEVSPLLYSRGDLIKYQAGCKTLINFIPLIQGPARRRGGTRFIAKTGNGSKPVVLMDFAYSETISYVLEFGDQYLRFFNRGRPVKAGGSVYQIATPWRQEDLFLENGLCALRSVQSADVMYIVCPTRPPQKLSRHGLIDWRSEALPNWARESARARAGEGPHGNATALFRQGAVA